MSMADYKNMIANQEGLETINCPVCNTIKPEGLAHRVYTAPPITQMNYVNGQRH